MHYKTIKAHDLLEENIILLHWKISQLILCSEKHYLSIFQGSLLNKYPWKASSLEQTISALFASCAEMQKPLENSLSQPVPQSFTVTLPPIS